MAARELAVREVAVREMAAGKQVKEPSKDFSHCRLSFIGSRSWDCLWNTAWLGPHGFLGGNNMGETKEQANKAADCHCYFKWFFEKPAHFETKAEKRDREKREKQERKADVRPAPVARRQYILYIRAQRDAWLRTRGVNHP